MASEIRVNSLTNRSGLSTVSITDTGVVVAGIVTATDAIFTGDITVTNGSFSGNVSVGGTLTYEDVTNIDSVGLITARNGLQVTSGNVGIGTDIPDDRLHVLGGNIQVGRFEETGYESILGNNVLRFNRTAASYIDQAGTGDIRFRYGSSHNTWMHMEGSNGNIGIGTITPGAKLEVFDATSNTILNVKSGDAGAVLNLIDDSARSSIEQNGTTLKISSDTGAEDADSDIRLQVDGASKMIIRSDGQIGMGIASPTQESGTGLHIRGTNGGQSRIHLTNSDTGDTATDGFYIISQGAESGGASGEVMLQQKENKALKFATNNLERLRIQSDGRIGINRATSSFMLDIVGNSSTGANCIRIVDGAETGHGSHPAKIVAGGTYYHEMQMHSRRFTVHTYDGSSIAERFRVHQDGTIKCGTSSVLKAEINNSVSGHQFISQCSDNNNGFEVYQQHGNTSSRNTLACYDNRGSGGAKQLSFAVVGDGNVSVPNGNVKMGNGFGIDFSATANSSGTMSSEVLDDYEEGTWTPVINKSGVGGTAGTPSTGVGYYRKVGKLLWISFYWYKSSGGFGNNAGEWYVSGLPYLLAHGTGGAYQFIPGGYNNINGTNYQTQSNRWQSNNTNGSATLAMYGPNATTNWTSGYAEFSATGCLMIP